MCYSHGIHDMAVPCEDFVSLALAACIGYMEKMNFPAAPQDRKEMAAWMPKITELVRLSSF
jgi:hypothetical protein